MNNIYTILIGVISFFILTAGIAFFSVLFPSKTNTDQTPKDFGHEYEEVIIPTEDGIALSGWLVEPDTTDQKDKIIIVMHGYPAEKGDVLGSTIHLAKEYSLLYFDFRGLGESGGRYSTVGIDERKDLAAAITYAKDEGYDEIGLWGFSVGGAVGLMQAPEFDAVNATVAISPYAKLLPLAQQLFRIPVLDRVLAQVVRGYAYLWTNTDIADISPKQAMSNYTKPVFIIHPRADRTIPFSNAKEIQAALSQNTNARFWFPEGSHGAFPYDEHNKKIQDFFDTHLQ